MTKYDYGQGWDHRGTRGGMDPPKKSGAPLSESEVGWLVIITECRTFKNNLLNFKPILGFIVIVKYNNTRKLLIIYYLNSGSVNSFSRTRLWYLLTGVGTTGESLFDRQVILPPSVGDLEISTTIFVYDQQIIWSKSWKTTELLSSIFWWLYRCLFAWSKTAGMFSDTYIQLKMILSATIWR